MEVLENASIKSLIQRWDEVERHIESLVDLIPWSLESVLKQWCDKWRRSGIIHSGCTSFTHNDIAWSTRLVVEKGFFRKSCASKIIFSCAWATPKNKGGSLEFERPKNLKDTTDLVLTGFVTGISGLAQVFSEHAVSLVAQDLISAMSVLENNALSTVYGFVRRQCDETYYHLLFVKAHDLYRMMDFLSVKVDELEKKRNHARFELKEISSALYKTRKIAKSGTVQSIRERVEELEKFLASPVC